MLAIALLVVLQAQAATAPEAAASQKAYVQGTLFLTSLPAGTALDDGPFSIAPPLSGRAIGISASGGRFVTTAVAVEGEFAYGRPISRQQRSTYRSVVEDYFNDYTAESRDLLFNALVRVRPAARGPIEIVAGGGLAINRIRERDGFRSTSRAPDVRTPFEGWSETSHLLTFSAGVDVPIALNRTFDLVPGFRWRFVERSGTPAIRAGINGNSYQLGAALRGGFKRPMATAPATGRAYAQGTVFITSNPAGVANHRVSPPLGGEAVGFSASGGYFVNSSTAVEGEFVVGGSVAAPQTWSYSSRTDYTADVRDVLLNGNARLRPGGKGPIEIVIGGGLAFTRVRELDRVTTYYLSPGRPSERSSDAAYFDRTYTVGGGVDAPIPVSARVSIVPSFRMRYARRAQESQARYVGAGPRAFQAGVTLRVKL